jgi:hypothetical protein
MIQEYYISVDIEADGPIPGDYSMRQLGAIFYTPPGFPKEDIHIKWNIEPLEGATEHPATKAWMEKMEAQQPGFLKRLNENAVSPQFAMEEFSTIVNQYNTAYDPHRPVVVAFPATFDYMFLLWYGVHFMGDRFPLDFASCVDMKSYAAPILGLNYRDTKKKAFPNRWKNKNMKHTHDALDDANGQGFNWFRMKEEAEALSNVYKSIQNSFGSYSISWKSSPK